MLRLLFLVSLLTGAAAADDCLVLIEQNVRDVAEESWMDRATVAHAGKDYTIVACDHHELAGLPQGEVLERAADLRSGYVNVWIASPAGREQAARLGRVVFSRGDYLLIRRAASLPEDFSLEGIHAVTPLRPYRPALREHAYPDALDRDPAVEQMVAAVDETIYQSAIQDLEDLETRNARTSMFALACSNVQATMSGLGLETELQTYTALPWYGEEFTCWNVIGEKVGTEFPEEIYIICGHLDSTAGQPWQAEPLAPGADDNASGSSVVLEAARVMADMDFRYTVRFICFGAEEQGLCGSTYYAEQAAAAGEDIRGVINIDMILYAPSGWEILRVYYDDQSTALAQALDAAAATYVPELEVEIDYQPGAAYSDHYPFWQNGYPAVQGSERRLSGNPYYHTTDDRLINYMDYFPFPTHCVKAAVATLATLAEPVGGSAVEPGASIAGLSRISFELQPNPARDWTRAAFGASASGIMRVTIHDVLGRVAGHPSASALIQGQRALDLDLGALSPGIYWVRATSGGRETARRLVVSR